MCGSSHRERVLRTAGTPGLTHRSGSLAFPACPTFLPPERLLVAFRNTLGCPTNISASSASLSLLLLKSQTTPCVQPSASSPCPGIAFASPRPNPQAGSSRLSVALTSLSTETLSLHTSLGTLPPKGLNPTSFHPSFQFSRLSPLPVRLIRSPSPLLPYGPDQSPTRTLHHLPALLQRVSRVLSASLTGPSARAASPPASHSYLKSAAPRSHSPLRFLTRWPCSTKTFSLCCPKPIHFSVFKDTPLSLSTTLKVLSQSRTNSTAKIYFSRPPICPSLSCISNNLLLTGFFPSAFKQTYAPPPWTAGPVPGASSPGYSNSSSSLRVKSWNLPRQLVHNKG